MQGEEKKKFWETISLKGLSHKETRKSVARQARGKLRKSYHKINVLRRSKGLLNIAGLIIMIYLFMHFC